MTEEQGAERDREWRQFLHVHSGYGAAVQGADLHVFRDRGPVYHLSEHHVDDAGPELNSWFLQQPSRMLTARNRVVDFTGRQEEMRGLVVWRDMPEHRIAARWMHAPGGQGKSRLTDEFAAESARSGWKVVTVRHGQSSLLPPTQSVDLRLGDAAGVLLVVDYADRWPQSHLSWLLSNALLHHHVPTRLLLLARSHRGWEPLSSMLEELRIDAGLHRLEPLPDDESGSREHMFTVARDCFARRYGLSDLAPVTAPASLSHPDFGLILTLHMAALVAVDAHVHGRRPPADLAGLSAYLLRRERRYWTQLYENRVEGLSFHTAPDVMARAVFTAILTGGMSHPQGVATMTTVLGGLAGETPPERVLSDHSRCYPPTGAGDAVLEPLYPDRLAEDFLALSLHGHGVDAHPAAPWAESLVTALTTRDRDGTAPPHIGHALVHLGHAAGVGRWPHVAAVLNSVLAADPALAVAGGSAALNAIAVVPGLDTEILQDIDSRLPGEDGAGLEYSSALVAARLADHHLAADAAPAVRAAALSHLAGRAQLAGMPETALEALRVALDAWVDAAREDQSQEGTAKVQAALAMVRIGGLLSTLGARPEEAFEVTQQGASLLSEALSDSPGIYAADYAQVLISLVHRLTDLNRYEEALEVMRPAVDLCRSLAAHEPDRYRFLLGLALQTSSGLLNSMGREEEAMESKQEAMRIHRQTLTEEQTDSTIRLLALQSAQPFTENEEESFAFTEEIVASKRRLASVSPVAHEADLADSLLSLSNRLKNRGQDTQSVETAREAVEILRRHAELKPAVHEKGLASSLRSLGEALRMTGQHDEALTVQREAVEILRRLADSNPTANEYEFASSLRSLGEALRMTGQHDEALTVQREAVEIYRRLSVSSALHKRFFSTFLTVFSSRLQESGHDDEALATAQEAREIQSQDPGAHSERELGASLLQISRVYGKTGRYAEAIPAAREAIALYERLSLDSAALREALATSLIILGVCLTQTGRGDEALSSYNRALEVDPENTLALASRG
ncbi:tetratricopeptide repeat protein, partial [Streptomyces sp. NPDC049910]|uniref:tetratricopeptide repeat protein n=1 Tax=Streptomyces sp. NPDC049910 TaxID=3155278 RepID=UPI003440A82E